MSVFGAYSHYYDLLYRDKNYRSETDFIADLLKRFGPQTKTVCELGCGTGRHASLLAQSGYEIHGVDLSEAMLDGARRRLGELPQEVARRLRFSSGDVCKIRLEEKFDAVLSLFHVVSYQPTNQKLLEMFNNAAAHLKTGGLFIFDYWYGPAVLAQKPATRIKRMESDAIAVTRLAEPEMHINQSAVDVNYHIFVRDKASGAVEELQETHRMRYLFASDIDFLARKTGFGLLHNCEWLSGEVPSERTWGVCSVLQKLPETSRIHA